MEDMILSWGHLYLTYNAKCVESPGEAIPNNEIFRRLAARMGYENEDDTVRVFNDRGAFEGAAKKCVDGVGTFIK